MKKEKTRIITESRAHPLQIIAMVTVDKNHKYMVGQFEKQGPFYTKKEIEDLRDWFYAHFEKKKKAQRWAEKKIASLRREYEKTKK